MKVTGDPASLFEDAPLRVRTPIDTDLANSPDEQEDVPAQAEHVARVDPLGIERREDEVVDARERCEDRRGAEPEEELVPRDLSTACKPNRCSKEQQGGRHLRAGDDQVPRDRTREIERRARRIDPDWKSVHEGTDDRADS